MAKAPRPIGEILVELGFITPAPLPTGTLALSRDELGLEGVADLDRFRLDALTFDHPNAGSAARAPRGHTRGIPVEIG